MRLAGFVLSLTLALAACSVGPMKVVVVDSSTYSKEYTPGMIREFFHELGYRRVKFQDYESGIEVLEKRNSDRVEIHFRHTTYTQILVKTHFDKLGNKVWIRFIEQGRTSLSDNGQWEYELLVKSMKDRLGDSRVSER